MARKDFKAGRDLLAGLSKHTQQDIVRAVNTVARDLRSLGSKKIREQVNLKASYVNERLYISRRANTSDPVAAISGRVRPTLLFRYSAKQLYRKAKKSGKKRLAGVRVKVKTGGSSKVLPGAWVMHGLKRGKFKGQGASAVVIRTGPRRNDYRTLYSASVDQVWKDVREELRPIAEAKLIKEFLRLRGLR